MGKFILSISVAICVPLCSVCLAQEVSEPPAPAEFDSDDPPEATIELTPYLFAGAQLGLQFEHERNTDVRSAENNDHSTFGPEMTLAALLQPTEQLSAYSALKFSENYQYVDGDQQSDRAALEVEEAYLLWKGIGGHPAALQIGRQRYEDEREWLFDEELDAARLYWGRPRLQLELSVSRKGLAERDTLNPDTEREEINNFILLGNYRPSEDTAFAAYIIGRDDRDDTQDDPIFWGIHAEGELFEDAGAWLELAYAGGREAGTRISAVGFDAGITYESDLVLQPSATIAWAYGSGDEDPEDDLDTNFRQTGLQGNEAGFAGEADFSYYGAFFEPELSNISIFTTGAGIKPTEQSSIDLVYHYYYQNEPSEDLRDSRLESDPNGVDHGLGEELDLVFGYQHAEDLEAAWISGYFLPGSAFESDRSGGVFAKVEIQYDF